MTKRIIFHIDVNSAYLSWEAAHRLQHGDPLDLREIPSVIGGDPKSRHGIILAKSIPAKKYEIQTGETLFSARLKCPDLVVVPPNYHLYMQCSTAMGNLLREYSPLVEQYSIDEYFLDYTDMAPLYGEPLEVAHLIKNRIREELGFTVNIGVSTNKLLAKMGSELKKPDRVHTLYPSEIQDKMWPLPIEDLFMVGRATCKKLRSRGIKTIGELAHCDPDLLKLSLKSHGVMIWNYANGRDLSTVHENRRPIIKGMGNSTTTSFDVKDRRTAHLVLLSLVETVAARLRLANYCAQLISVSLKTNEFCYFSHQRKIYTPTDCTNVIHQIVCELFDHLWAGQPLRHLGVRASELCENDFIQLSLFSNEKQRKLDRTVDAIREKFGVSAMYRASFVGSGLRPIIGGTGDIQEYPMMSSLL